MRKIKYISIIFILILSSCTSYQRLGFGGGYTDKQLSENTFYVSFRGNGYTSWDRVYNFYLRRAAEVMRENGFSYFTISDGGGKTNTNVIINDGNVDVYNKYTEHGVITGYHDYVDKCLSVNLVLKEYDEKKARREKNGWVQQRQSK